MLTPPEAFARMRENWLSNAPTFAGDLLAEDVVIELPFAAPGRPNRIAGRQHFLDFASAGRATLPIRFDDCHTIAIHETTDPEVIVVEYELTGTLTTTGESGSAPFIGILRVREGKIASWREYQNPLALAWATGAASP